MNHFINYHFARCGILGFIFTVIATTVPQIVFRNPEGERFSMLNHFISELGWVGVSEWAWIFNAGFITAGPFFAIYLIGLCRQHQGRWARWTRTSGIAAALSLSLVGLCPLRDDIVGIIAHLIAACSIGTSSWIFINCFLMMTFKDQFRVLPKVFFISILVFGVLCLIGGVICLIGELRIRSMDNFSPHFDFQAIRIVDRPDPWIMPIMEWFSGTSTLFAVGLSAFYMEFRRIRLARSIR